jgi:DNA-binding response OmpR family regulator
MMPDLSGVELLKFIRSVPKLAPTPVVLLTNCYRNDLGRQAAVLGIEKALLKGECSPSVLMAAIDEILEPGLAMAKPPEPVAPSAAPTPAFETEFAPTAPTEDAVPAGTEEPGVETGGGLLADAPAICADLGQLYEALARELRNGPEQQANLEDLFCKVHHLAAAAGQSGFELLAQITAMFDGLLHVLMENPQRLGPSVLRTVGSLVEVVLLLFQQGCESALRAPVWARVLILHDDPLANEMAIAALGAAQVSACSTEDSLVAWQWLNSEQFDLVLFDINMRVLDGLQLCQRLRMVSGYEKTPVILVTAQEDFDARSTSSLSGADDLIAKPILPQELAAKVVVNLVRAQMEG